MTRPLKKKKKKKKTETKEIKCSIIGFSVLFVFQLSFNRITGLNNHYGIKCASQEMHLLIFEGLKKKSIFSSLM